MPTDANTGRTPTARLSDCERYLRNAMPDDIVTAVDPSHDDRFHVFNEGTDLDEEEFTTIVLGAVDEHQLFARLDGDDDSVAVELPHA